MSGADQKVMGELDRDRTECPDTGFSSEFFIWKWGFWIFLIARHLNWEGADEMNRTNDLPGVELARSVLGLDYSEIALAVQADENTLYRWRQGEIPTAIYLSRLERLNDLVLEIQRTIRLESIEGWLDKPIPSLDGKTPRQMLLKGRSEDLLELLTSLNVGFSH